MTQRVPAASSSSSALRWPTCPSPCGWRLRHGTDDIVQRIALCLRECQSEGTVPAHTDAAALALTLYELWLGASLLAKLRRDGSAFEHALQSTRQLLGVPAA